MSTALITGASRGLGAVAGRRLAEQGTQTVEEGTDAIVAAVLATEGPSGRFVEREDGIVPW